MAGYDSKPLEEPFKKKTLAQQYPHKLPPADEMLRHNRGPNVGCCSRPSGSDMRKRH
jgi:hypothetical protein